VLGAIVDSLCEKGVIGRSRSPTRIPLPYQEWLNQRMAILKQLTKDDASAADL
jgi:hypothetical protein